jgi:transcriptional regulator with XRE-family HTH domain
MSDDLPIMPGFREMAERRRALAARLVELRHAAGLSQTQVAARMGTSQSAVARLEAGDVDARLSTLEKYAAAIGQSLELGVIRKADQ